MAYKTTYRAGEIFPEDVLHFIDQHGVRWPVKVRSDLDAHVDGDTLFLTIRPGATDGAIEVDTGPAEGLHLKPAPVEKLHITAPSINAPSTRTLGTKPLSKVGQRMAEIEGRLERLEFPDND